jgi:hypothetical protein
LRKLALVLAVGMAGCGRAVTEPACTVPVAPQRVAMTDVAGDTALVADIVWLVPCED